MATMWSELGLPLYLTVALGVAAVAVSILQVVHRRSRSYGSLIVGLVAATFLASLWGFGAGLWAAYDALQHGTPESTTANYMAVALGLAGGYLAWGGLLGTLGAVAGGIAIHARQSASKVP